MTARVCCSLSAVLLCLCVYLSTTDAEEAARVNRSVRLAARLSEPEKPGVCPRKNLEVAVSDVCVGLCSHDSDCLNDQKCCSNGCGRQCVDPYKGPAKPGVCPKNNVEVAVSGVCAEMCSHDSDCPKDQKCCSNGCGHKCVAPYKEPAKPGVCPRNNVEDAMLRPCVESCSHDRDCPKDQKCCSNGCGHQCMAPYKGPAKPGVCPKTNVGVCAEMCSHDRDCPKDQKCCSNGCGHQCMPPYKEKPGVCPRRFVGEGLCKKLCASDIDCPDDQKCCRTKCGRECTSPF